MNRFTERADPPSRNWLRGSGAFRIGGRTELRPMMACDGMASLRDCLSESLNSMRDHAQPELDIDVPMIAEARTRDEI